MTNVLVVMTDDLRVEHLEAMPITRTRLVPRGRSFTQARCNVALCQPARVGFLTGQLSRDHGNLSVGFEGAPDLPVGDSPAAWLAAVGYRCGMFGKYVNGIDGFGGIDPPEGWSTWREFIDGRSAEDFTVRDESGLTEVVGLHQSDYLVREAKAFISAAPEPWFAYVSPSDAHAPFHAHPDLLHAFARSRCREVPREDRPDLPDHIRERPPLTAIEWADIQAAFRGRLREVSMVDRVVGELLDLLDELGQTERTVVLLTSDNGVYQGEHRRRGVGSKGGPYDVALRVPMVVAGPGFVPGPDVDAPVYPHQDLTATLVDLAGATPTLPHQGGSSLRAVAADPAAFAGRALLHELAAFEVSGDALSTGPRHPMGFWKLVRTPSVRDGASTVTYELYDLASDPDELVNLAGVAEQRPVRDELERTLLDLLRAPADR